LEILQQSRPTNICSKLSSSTKDINRLFSCSLKTQPSKNKTGNKVTDLYALFLENGKVDQDEFNGFSANNLTLKGIDPGLSDDMLKVLEMISDSAKLSMSLQTIFENAAY